VKGRCQIYIANLLYGLWQQTMGIIFKYVLSTYHCIDFSNGGRSEKRCETKRHFHCVKL